jgi:circadian clock protein KaiC
MLVPMPPTAAPPVALGIPGLDRVLLGGIPSESLCLVEGLPGSGKTTLALQFLLEGVRRGETCLLVSNAETPAQLERIAASHGWSLERLQIAEWKEGLNGSGEGAPADYTLFPEAEVEVGETLTHLFDEIEQVRPTRLVIDSISGLRLVAPTAAFYRRQLKRIASRLAARRCTSLLLDDGTASEADTRARTLASIVIELSVVEFSYGSDRRMLRVRKLRGASYVRGAHDFSIETGGLVVYPRLVAGTYDEEARGGPASSGVEALDALAGGGLPRGSGTLFLGPAGSGKSSLASLYVHAAAQRGERCALYLFDESVESYFARSRGLGIDLRSFVGDGRVMVDSLDPAELTPGQIADRIVGQVEDGAGVVLIDSLNGYLQSALHEAGVLLHLRELLSFLSRRGVVSLLTMTQHGVLGAEMSTPFDISFLSDNVFLLRYFEAHGQIRKALSLVKRRSGPHETTIRELRLGAGGIRPGEPLTDFVGVMTGTPVYTGSRLPTAGAS